MQDAGDFLHRLHLKIKGAGIKKKHKVNTVDN